MKSKKILAAVLVVCMLLVSGLALAAADDVVKIRDLNLNLPSQVTLAAGTTMPIPYTVMPYNADEPMRWESTNPAVATVDQFGNLTTIAAGVTKIRCHVRQWYVEFELTVTGAGASGATSGAAVKIPAKTKTASVASGVAYYDASNQKQGTFTSKTLFVAGKAQDGMLPVYSAGGIVYVQSSKAKVQKTATPKEGVLMLAQEDFTLCKTAGGKSLVKVPEGTMVVVIAKAKVSGYYLMFAAGKTGYAPMECVG